MYVLFAFAYVRAVSSTPLIVYAALVTSLPPLMVVNAGAISTSRRPMMPTTMSNSRSVKPRTALPRVQKPTLSAENWRARSGWQTLAARPETPRASAARSSPAALFQGEQTFGGSAVLATAALLASNFLRKIS